MRFSLSFKILVANATILLLLVVATVIMVFGADRQRTEVAAASRSAELAAVKVLDLVATVKSLNLDIIQIQQWLTDVSATRGLDGLNDGFDEAEAARGRADANLAAAEGLLRAMDATALLGDLDQVRRAVAPYYGRGVEMAQAYVAGGPAAGNQMMAAFDAEAETLSTALETLVAKVDGVAAEARGRMQDQLARASGIAGELELTAIVLTVAGIAVALLVSLVLQRHVVRPLAGMTTALGRIADGELDVTIPDAARRTDEIAGMALALATLLERTAENVRLRGAQRESELAAERGRREALVSMAETVEREAGRAVDQVASESRLMDETAVAMAVSAAQVSENAQGVSVAAEHALANAEAVASATEELTASIREISGQISHAMSVSRQAVDSGERTRVTIDSLSSVVSQIGDVANLIRDIASQTNLLALNATIEAARAGEAGKGFAVVAGEVKSLANQTTQSTEEIGRQIAAIQAVTGEAVAAVAQITVAIQEMDHVSTAIAAAMEEQSAATGDIARNVSETADAAREVAHRIASVSDEARGTGDKAATMRNVADRVADGVGNLRQTLVRVVRTATTDVDRRGADRVAVDRPCEVRVAGRTLTAYLVNISTGGALLRDVDLPPGAHVQLITQIAGAPIACRVVAADGQEANLAFEGLDSSGGALLSAWLSSRGAPAAA